MNVILFDKHWNNLLPITYTRPVADIRCGIYTIREKWESILQVKTSTHTQSYLSKKFPTVFTSDNLLINSAALPNHEFVEKVEKLQLGECIKSSTDVLAIRLEEKEAKEFLQSKSTSKSSIQSLKHEPSYIDECWKIFKYNGQEIALDITRMGIRPSKVVPGEYNQILGTEVYIESGVRVNASTLNSTTGPIYLGKGSEVMEGSHIRGPFALGEGATVKMGAKIYGDTTIGPHCKVGGELSNVVMFAYSNKGHDGFIGNSVIGEWCNFGADTNSSNLKNNYSSVRIWSYASKKAIESNLQFCGIIAADHVKTGINTMLNTATVLGVSANVFGADFPQKFVPSFSWGGAKKMETFKLNKAYEVAENMMKRRGVELSALDKQILEHVFLADSLYRK